MSGRMQIGWLLDFFSMGVVVLDADGIVRAMNQRARRLFDGPALQIVGGRVVATRRHDAVALRRLFEGACPNGMVGDWHVRNALQLTGTSGTGNISVLVADTHANADATATGFVFFLHEQDGMPNLDEGALRAIHGLTRTEARIAARMVAGETVAGIAMQVGVSQNTVRTHLKRVFAKTGARTQSALTRIVLTGPAALQIGNGHPMRSRRGA